MPTLRAPRRHYELTTEPPTRRDSFVTPRHYAPSLFIVYAAPLAADAAMTCRRRAMMQTLSDETFIYYERRAMSAAINIEDDAAEDAR